MLKFVRKLTIWWNPPSPATLNRDETLPVALCCNWNLFLTTMPRDRLMELHCNRALGFDLMMVLLQSHRRIKALRFPIYFHGYDDSWEYDGCLSKVPWIEGYLGPLQSLEVNLHPAIAPFGFMENKVLRDYRSIIERAPKLKRLSIQVPKHRQLASEQANMYGLTFTGQPGALRQLDLNELSLNYLNLNGTVSLMQQVDFRRLRK
jgi:hypothetical protein